MKTKIWTFTLAMGLLLILSSSCKKEDENNNNNNNNTVTDIDGNVYHAVTLGTQTWLVENLKTTKYRNGDPIRNITDDETWYDMEEGAQCDYDNDPTNGNKYGKLYNWHAIGDGRNIAPLGWHVASDADWNTLETFVANNYGTSISVGKILSAASDWVSSSEQGAVGNDLTNNNASGFTGLPGGYRDYDGAFKSIGRTEYWWSYTESDVEWDDNAWYRSLNFSDGLLVRDDNFNKECGFAIRCVLGEGQLPVVTTSLFNTIFITATGGGNVTAQGTKDVTARGVCYSTDEKPDINDLHTLDGAGIGSFESIITGLNPNTKYNVRAYATSDVGTSYGDNITLTTGGSVTDIDGNVYGTVVIGTQEWMVENLKVTHYQNGDPITNELVYLQWKALNTGAYCWYDNDETNNRNLYGGLYNWYAVVDSRNICPIGWHIPSEAEWAILTTYLGGENIAGDKLKKVGWGSNATNESGFTGLPGGGRGDYTDYYGDGFGYKDGYGYWWSSDEFDNNSSLSRGLGYNYSGFSGFPTLKYYGFSIRCIKD
jgi:uncharacterized protein (TIGR02145 family)